MHLFRPQLTQVRQGQGQIDLPLGQGHNTPCHLRHTESCKDSKTKQNKTNHRTPRGSKEPKNLDSGCGGAELGRAWVLKKWNLEVPTWGYGAGYARVSLRLRLRAHLPSAAALTSCPAHLKNRPGHPTTPLLGQLVLETAHVRLPYGHAALSHRLP